MNTLQINKWGGLSAAVAMAAAMGAMAGQSVPADFGSSPFKTSDPNVKIGSISVRPATGDMWQHDQTNKDTEKPTDAGRLTPASTSENPMGEIDMTVNHQRYRGVAPLVYEKKDGDRVIYESRQTLYTSDRKHNANVMLELSHEADRQTGNYTVRNGSVILDSVDDANHH